MNGHPADWLDRARAVLHRDLGHFLPWWCRGLVRGLVLACGPFVELRGGERLAALPEPSLLVLNHNNTFECLALPPLLLFERGGRPIHFLVDWMYLRIPLVGAVLRAGTPIPVYTKRARWGLWERHRLAHRRASPISLARARLAAGGTVGIFPEGTRNGSTAALLRGRRGLGRLILQSEAPVVPIGMEFTAGRRLGRMPRVGRVQAAVGEPLDFAAERQAARAGLGRPESPAQRRRRLSAAEARVVHQVMTRLAALCSKPYPFSDPAGRPWRPPQSPPFPATPGR